jgi:hypothetical protein
VRDIQVISVVSPYVHEVQTITVAGAISGQFVLLVAGTSSSIGPFNFDASADTVRTAVQQFTNAIAGSPCSDIGVTRAAVRSCLNLCVGLYVCVYAVCVRLCVCVLCCVVSALIGMIRTGVSVPYRYLYVRGCITFSRIRVSLCPGSARIFV